MNLSHEVSMSSELALTSFVEAFLLFCFFTFFILKKKLNSFLFLVLFFPQEDKQEEKLSNGKISRPFCFGRRRKTNLRHFYSKRGGETAGRIWAVDRVNHKLTNTVQWTHVV